MYIYSNCTCIASHKRSYARFKYATVLEHKTYPEQAYKSCAGILSFARQVGAKRLINVCRYADSYGLYNYPAIEKILNNR